MTKDRRLGRGLAALLGTPQDESGIVDGSVTNVAPNSVVDRAIANRPRPLSAGPIAGGVTGSVPLNALLPFQQQSHNDHSANSGPGADNAGVRPSANPLSAPELGSPAEHSALTIDVSLIDANPFQPRRQFNEEEIASLAASIQEHQQLQPILVRKVGARYQLISGERRLRATIHAGLSKVRAEVREADDRLVAELAIVENLQRKDLNAVEKALSFRRYLDEHRCTQDELAKRLKIDRSTIANLMRLLELPEVILTSIQSDALSAGHARALLPLGEESQQIAMARQIQAEGWNVRQTERAVTEILSGEDGSTSGNGRGKRTVRTITAQVGSLEQELKKSLGTKIEIKQSSRGRGRIIVHFNSIEEFERIRGLLVPESQRAVA